MNVWKIAFFTLLILIILFVVSNANIRQEVFSFIISTNKTAVATFSDSVKGTVIFKEVGDIVEVAVNLTNVKDKNGELSNNLHGFHIHQYGDLSNGCTSAGAHFDILGHKHGDINLGHSGDLGNIRANNGEISAKLRTKTVGLRGVKNIIGRSVVLHSDPDDLGQGNDPESQITGNSGARIGCAVIGLRK